MTDEPVPTPAEPIAKEPDEYETVGVYDWCCECGVVHNLANECPPTTPAAQPTGELGTCDRPDGGSIPHVKNASCVRWRKSQPTQPVTGAPLTADNLAQMFHEAYERLAPNFGYETRKTTAVPWEKVSGANKRLMLAVAGEILGKLSSPAGARERAEQLAKKILTTGGPTGLKDMADIIERAWAGEGEPKVPNEVFERIKKLHSLAEEVAGSKFISHSHPASRPAGEE